MYNGFFLIIIIICINRKINSVNNFVRLMLKKYIRKLFIKEPLMLVLVRASA
jgi:hypothetical protein